MGESILIRGGRILDPANHMDIRGDLLIQKGKIAEIAPEIDVQGAKVIQAEGMIVAPGLVDIHVHLRDPGFTHKEDIISGTKAAAAGGVTTVAAMPNTKPVTDSPEVISYILEKAKDCPAKVVPIAAITKGQNGEILTDFAALKAAGAGALSDDGKPVATAKLMQDAMIQAHVLKMPVLAHCEDVSLSGKGIIHQGAVSETLGVEGIPSSAEDVGTAREIAISAATGRPVHICHVSTATSVMMIRAAKKDGVKVTAETGPHYFTLTQDALQGRDADYRMNPPLRTSADKAAIIAGLADGTIDVIATDHAPHTREEKADFEKAPNGIVGLETSLAASITALVQTGVLTIHELLLKMSYNPSKILGLDSGTLSIGSDADIAVFAPDEMWTVDPQKLHGKASNTAFKGMNLTGRVKYTFCRGVLVYEDK